MGSSTEHSAYGPTRNPLAPDRVPGGSSGGSAAAVAAGIVPVALGSETGGSVRQPAAFCGIVGVKPTYGRVSRFGLVAFASSLDQVGVFGAHRRRCGARRSASIAGRDPLDSTSADVPVPDYHARARDASVQRARRRPAEGILPGVARSAHSRSGATRALEHAARARRGRSATCRCRTPTLAIPVYYIVAPAEASSNLARFDGVRYGLRIDGDGLRGMYEATRSRGFGPEVTRRILLGTYVLSAGYYDAYYRKAQQVRTLIADDFRRRLRERRATCCSRRPRRRPRSRSARSPIRTRCT